MVAVENFQTEPVVLTKMGVEEVTHAIQNNYSVANEAFQNKDIGRIADLMSPDFSGIGPEGQSLNRDQVLESVNGQFKNLESITFPREIEEIKIEGESAIAKVRGVFAATDKGGSPVEIDVFNEDVWHHGPSGWTMVRSKALDATVQH